MNKVLFFFLLFASSIVTFAQYPEYTIQTFNTENGLPYGNITSILQDSRGYMWIGTNNGLLRYDGYSFTSFTNNQKSNSLSNNIITELYESSDSVLFIGTRQGLNFFNVNTLEINRIQNQNKSLQNISIKNLSQSNFSEVYASSITNNKLLRYNYNSKTYTFQIQEIPLQIFISNLQIDAKKRMWISNTKELFCKAQADKGFKKIPIDLNGGFIHKLYSYKQNSILIGTSKGLYMWDDNSQRIIPIPWKFNGIKNIDLYVTDIHVDNKGKIYIATDNIGLVILEKNGEQIAHYKHNPQDNMSIHSNSVYTVYTDNMDNIWLGILGEGLQVLYKNRTCYNQYFFKKSSFQNTLPSNLIKVAIEDSIHNLWVASDGEGLSYINTKTGEIKNYDFSNVASNKLMCLNLQKDVLYIGTYNGGLAKLNIKSGSPSKIPIFANGKEVTNIFDIENYTPNKLLIASLDVGLFLYDIKTKQTISLQTFTWKNRIIQLNQYISTIQKDLYGNYWIASLGEGIYVLNKKLEFIDLYSPWEPNNKIHNSVVSSLSLDSKGRIWAGTMNGILVIDRKNKTIKNISESDGLISSNILDISCDKNYAWVTNLRGLSRINCNTFSTENYTSLDGIISSRLSYISTTVLKNNILLVTGDNGLIKISVDSLKKRTPNLLFKLSNLYVNGNPILLKNDLKLAYNENNIRITFPAFNYAYSHRITYECFVSGQITATYNLSNKPDLYFANLAPGKYTIHLRAYFENRKSDAKTITFTFIISPPFWQTWWFILLIIVSIVGVSLYSIRRRFYRMQKQAFILEQKVFERTQMIQNQNNELEMQSEKLQEINDELIRTNSDQTKLFHILKQTNFQTKNENILPKSHDEEMLEKAMTYIYEHIGDVDLSVEHLSNNANYSKIQFYRKIKSITGLTPIDVIRTTRLQKAAEFLVVGKYSITDVCYLVGFSDPRYFSKCFKEQYDCSPTEYIKKHVR